jgi:hypothetical protein
MGRTLWGILYIDIVFVPAELRHSGIGTELVLRAEDEAVNRGCHCSWLDPSRGGRTCTAKPACAIERGVSRSSVI